MLAIPDEGKRTPPITSGDHPIPGVARPPVQPDTTMLVHRHDNRRLPHILSPALQRALRGNRLKRTRLQISTTHRTQDRRHHSGRECPIDFREKWSWKDNGLVHIAWDAIATEDGSLGGKPGLILDEQLKLSRYYHVTQRER